MIEIPHVQDRYLKDLETYSQKDAAAAGEAFARLWDRVKSPLLWHLRCSGLSDADCEDILQISCARLWSVRTSFQPRGPGAWWGFARKVTHNVARDERRKRQNREVQEPEEEDDIPEKDLPYVDTLVLAAENLRHLYAAADRLWLGMSMDDPQNNSYLLAAQLFHLHGLDAQSISELLPTVDQNTLDEWIVQPSALRNLAYRQLYWDNDKLTGFVLRPEKPYSPSELDDITHQISKQNERQVKEWPAAEVLVILWHHRNGLYKEQILRFERCTLSGPEIDELMTRCREIYPFKKIATKLRRSFGRFDATGALADPFLFRRLVFQYHVKDELPHKQILDRTVPASETLGVKLTETTLTGWLGMGRLFTQLAAFMAREQKNAA